MKRLLIAFIVLMPATSFAQEDSMFRFIRYFEGAIADFSVDNLGSTYIVFEGGQLKKLNAGGDSLAVFNNVRKFGKLHSIDVSNPLKVLLYYRDFGTIVILDRFLNVRSTIDLRKQNLLQVKAIGQSYDNNIWIFDELEVKLKKIGDDGRLIDQSNDFRLIFDSIPSPAYIIDQEKYVYLYDPAKGAYAFDYYGAFKSRVPYTGWTDFSVINGVLVGRDESRLYRYDSGTLNASEFILPLYMRNARKIVVTASNLYVLKDGSIMVYSHK